jgi:hypothetical protein
MTRLNDRQAWLLIYMLSKHPIGICEIHGVPYSCTYSGKYYGCPSGIGLGNMRGLERRGYVRETYPGLFYLTENGVLAAEHAAGDERWA